MRYVIAGSGGAYGSHYFRKLDQASARGDLTNVDSVLVVDRDPRCAAAQLMETSGEIIVSTWRAFGRSVFEEPESWRDDVWIPAPIAPHVLAEWVTDQVLRRSGLAARPSDARLSPAGLPVERWLPDGRLLLSHAPGTCPVDCTEPGDCAITRRHRWWEMSDTVSDMLAPSGIEESSVARFFCRHHCDPGELDVGGIRFSTIFAQTDAVLSAVAAGRRTIGVATYSSCHGVVNLFDLVPAGLEGTPAAGSDDQLVPRP